MKKDNYFALAHYFSGLTVILHGFAEFDRSHGKPLFYFICGAMMILTGIFHQKLIKFLRKSEGILFFIEGTILLFISFHFFEMGKKILPIVHLLGGLFYFYLGFIKLSGQKTLRNQKK